MGLADKGHEVELLNYSFRVYELFEGVTKYFNNEHLRLTHKIKRNLVNVVPDLSSAKNLSNMAIRALRSTDGITTVLVGMVKVDYVIDVLEELKNSVEKNLDWDNIKFNYLIE